MTDVRPQPVRASVSGEWRTDRAERRLQILQEGPRLSYLQRKYSGPQGYVNEPRSMSAESVLIVWDQGDLSDIVVHGRRVKKDGTVGLAPHRLHWKVSGGTLVGATEAPGWLSALIMAYSEPPALKSLREVGR
jgi:hypothetical protein